MMQSCKASFQNKKKFKSHNTFSFCAVITELGNSSRLYCELSARVEPVVGDVVMALVSMGIKHASLEVYAQRSRRLILPTPTQAAATKQIGILQTGQKRPHPSHIPDHLPSFPDSHAYVQTPVC